MEELKSLCIYFSFLLFYVFRIIFLIGLDYSSELSCNLELKQLYI